MTIAILPNSYCRDFGLLWFHARGAATDRLLDIQEKTLRAEDARRSDDVIAQYPIAWDWVCYHDRCVAWKSSSHWQNASGDEERFARFKLVASKSRFHWRETSGDRKCIRLK